MDRIGVHPNNDDDDAYAARFAPPRELVCPITQELLRDPVVAEDGHTYERTSIVTWFGTGQTRSPVTNALLENASAAGLVPNLAAAGLAAAHRSRLGEELASICREANAAGVGARMAMLLDSGADPNGRGEGGDTPLHLLIQSGNIHLATYLLDHDASVRHINDAGLDCIAAAENASAHSNRHNTTIDSEWHEFIRELKRREAAEKMRAEARDRARSQANDEHRERQRSLAATAREGRANGGPRGLGRLEEGVGYFPSLATLQFQGSVPGPSPSVAEHEDVEKERLNSILRGLGAMVFVYLLLS